MQVSITRKICNCSVVIIKIHFLECRGCIERLILFDFHIVVCIHIFCFSCMLILLFLNYRKYFNSLIALDLGQNILFGATMQVFFFELACKCPMVISSSDACALSTFIEMTLQYTYIFRFICRV